MLAMDIYSLAIEGYKGYSDMFYLMEKGRQMTEVFDQTMEVLEYALGNGMIDDKYLNETSMDHLFNVIMYGGDDSGSNKTPYELVELGITIYNIYQNQSGNTETIGRDYESIKDPAFHSESTRVSPTILKSSFD